MHVSSEGLCYYSLAQAVLNQPKTSVGRRYSISNYFAQV